MAKKDAMTGKEAATPSTRRFLNYSWQPGDKGRVVGEKRRVLFYFCLGLSRSKLFLSLTFIIHSFALLSSGRGGDVRVCLPKISSSAFSGNSSAFLRAFHLSLSQNRLLPSKCVGLFPCVLRIIETILMNIQILISPLLLKFI